MRADLDGHRCDDGAMGSVAGPLLRGATYRRGAFLLLGGVVVLPYALVAVALGRVAREGSTPPGLVVPLVAAVIGLVPPFLRGTRTVEIAAVRGLLGVDLPEPPVRVDREARLRSALWYALHLAAAPANGGRVPPPREGGASHGRGSRRSPRTTRLIRVSTTGNDMEEPMLKKAVLALTAAGAVLTATTTPAAAGAEGPSAFGGNPLTVAGGKAPTEPSIVGQGTTWRPAGDDVFFKVDAHGLGTDARGTFYVSHYLDGRGGWFRGTVDCLVVVGGVVVLTGIVTDGTDPEWAGIRRGITIHDKGRHDRLGYSWVVDDNAKSVPLCTSSAPFAWVETGDFKAVQWIPIESPPWDKAKITR